MSDKRKWTLRCTGIKSGLFWTNCPEWKCGGVAMASVRTLRTPCRYCNAEVSSCWGTVTLAVISLRLNAKLSLWVRQTCAVLFTTCWFREPHKIKKIKKSCITESESRLLSSRVLEPSHVRPVSHHAVNGVWFSVSGCAFILKETGFRPCLPLFRRWRSTSLREEWFTGKMTVRSKRSKKIK